MGNCQDDITKQDYEFKRKKIFHRKSDKQNIPPTQPNSFQESQQKDVEQTRPFNDLTNLNHLTKQNTKVPHYIDNSVVKLQISTADLNKPIVSRKNLPYIVSDQFMSLGEISNVPPRNIRSSIEDMIETFQAQDETKDQQELKNQETGHLPEGQLHSHSWGRSTREDIGIKYTNSYYLPEEDSFPIHYH